MCQEEKKKRERETKVRERGSDLLLALSPPLLLLFSLSSSFENRKHDVLFSRKGAVRAREIPARELPRRGAKGQRNKNGLSFLARATFFCPRFEIEAKELLSLSLCLSSPSPPPLSLLLTFSASVSGRLRRLRTICSGVEWERFREEKAVRQEQKNKKKKNDGCFKGGLERDSRAPPPLSLSRALSAPLLTASLSSIDV